MSEENKVDYESQVQEWLDAWKIDPVKAKDAFICFYQWLKDQGQVKFEFKPRAGISYSLRAAHTEQKERPLFVLIDVVDDDPNERWLSVCFYADLVNDPDALGDFVPQGLMGKDALCLNLEEENMTMRDYIKERIAEAFAKAKDF